MPQTKPNQRYYWKKPDDQQQTILHTGFLPWFPPYRRPTTAENPEAIYPASFGDFTDCLVSSQWRWVDEPHSYRIVQNLIHTNKTRESRIRSVDTSVSTSSLWYSAFATCYLQGKQSVTRIFLYSSLITAMWTCILIKFSIKNF